MVPTYPLLFLLLHLMQKKLLLLFLTKAKIELTAGKVVELHARNVSARGSERTGENICDRGGE